MTARRLLSGVLTCFLLSLNTFAGEKLYIKYRTDIIPNSSVTSQLVVLDGVREIKALSTSSRVQSHEILSRWRVIELDDTADRNLLIATLLQRSEIDVVESAPVRHTCAYQLDNVTNDPLSGFQWHLDAIDAQAAWDMVPDASSVVVAVVDIGVQIDHPDLEANIWVNQAEAEGATGVDDDNNGYVDDIHGWNAYDQNGDPSPSGPGHVHGTHVSGIISAVKDNHIGVAGVSSGARIMAVRAGIGRDVTHGFDGILYAVEAGADIINLSWGGDTFSLLEYDIIRYAHSQGVHIIAASGNSGTSRLHYPAANPEVLSIAATDSDDRLASFSNRGWWVDVAGPGVDIFSTKVDGYKFDSGTSMACPVVVGVVAMMLAQDPDQTLEEIRARLSQGSEPIGNTNSNLINSGRINAWRALNSERPVLIFNAASYTDDDNDDVLEIGENGTIQLDFLRSGPSPDRVEVRLIPLDDAISTSGYTIVSGNNNGTITLDPMSILVDPNAVRGSHPLGIGLNIDGYQDTMIVRVPIDPDWRSHESSNMVASISDFGAIGYWDYIDDSETPEGIRLKSKKSGFLYHGSVLISDGENVADCAYGTVWTDQFDLITIPGGEIRQAQSAEGFQVFQAMYTGIEDGFENLTIRQESISEPDGENYVIIEYDIYNGGFFANNYNLAVYCDWDIGTHTLNTVEYDPVTQLSAILGNGGAAGIVALGDQSVSGAIAIDNQDHVYDGFADSTKLRMMTTGIVDASDNTERDWSHLIAVDLGTINPSERAVTAFAIVAGNNLSEIEQAAQRARQVYGSPVIKSPGHEGPLPERFVLHAPWPNPFNSTMSIRMALPEAGNVAVRVFDLLGRNVRTLKSGNLEAGNHRFQWQGINDSFTPVASGIYFIQANWNGQNRIVKTVLVK